MNITFEQGWVFVDHLAVYPRDDGTFSVGQPTGKPREYYDVSVGYENQDAAIDQAIWFATEGLAPLPSAVPSECKQTPEWVLRSDAPTGIHSDQQPQVKGMACPFPINQQTPYSAMTYDEAKEVVYNPRIRSVTRLLRAARRLIESGREGDWKLAKELRDRAQERAAEKPL